MDPEVARTVKRDVVGELEALLRLRLILGGVLRIIHLDHRGQLVVGERTALRRQSRHAVGREAVHAAAVDDLTGSTRSGVGVACRLGDCEVDAAIRLIEVLGTVEEDCTPGACFRDGGLRAGNGLPACGRNRVAHHVEQLAPFG